VEWEITFGLPGYYERVVAVSQSGDGGYTIVGGKGLGVDWRSNTRGPSSTYVLKIDASGKKTWEKEVAVDCSTLGNALQMEDGGFLIGILPGSTSGNTDPLLRNITIIRVSPSGDKVWEKTFGGEKDDYMTSMEKTGDGGFLIAGSTNSFSAGGDYDAYLIRINGSGEKVWEKTFGGVDDDGGQIVRQATDGGFLIAGRTCVQRTGDDNIYLIRVDSSGNRIWEKIVGGRGPDFVKEMHPTRDGAGSWRAPPGPFRAGKTSTWSRLMTQDRWPGKGPWAGITTTMASRCCRRRTEASLSSGILGPLVKEAPPC